MTAACTWSFTTAATSALSVSVRHPCGPPSMRPCQPYQRSLNQAVQSSTIIFTFTNNSEFHGGNGLLQQRHLLGHLHSKRRCPLR